MTDLTDTDKEKEIEKEPPPTDPFDVLQKVIESKGIILNGEADITALTEIVGIGATPEDVQAAIVWKSANNGGRPIRYVNQLTGPTKTAMAKRLQGGGNGVTQEFVVGPGGRVNL